jgi:hypothetical protein
MLAAEKAAERHRSPAAWIGRKVVGADENESFAG